MGDVDALTGRFRLLVPGDRHVRRTAVRVPARSSDSRAPRIPPSTGLRSPARAATSTWRSSATTPSTGRRSGWRTSGSYVNLMTSRADELAAELRATRHRAHRPWGVALELLLLPRGRAAAGDAVRVPPARPVRSTCASAVAVRCPACGVDVDQPRHAVARRRPVPLGRAAWASSRTSSSEDALRDDRRLPRPARVGDLRREAAAARWLSDRAAFPPGRDHRRVLAPADALECGQPSTTNSQMDTRASNLHLLRDCLALGKPVDRRPPAKVRLEEALGPELARKLVSSLAAKRP